MGIYRSMTGTLIVEVTSADISRFLTAISDHGISILRTEYVDDLTVLLHIHRSDYTAVMQISSRRGEKTRLHQRAGIYWVIRRMQKRPLLITGMLLLLTLIFFLPSRVLIVEVEGNAVIPERLIIEQAASCGIGFGASRREVRSERVKNNLLSAVPELQWVGVNTRGCVAVISVQERIEPKQTPLRCGVSSIVAARDGIIASCTVTKGTSLCKIGQAVKAGEVLVSGYTDLGLCIQATTAEAEIFAETKRDLAVVTPLNYTERGEPVRIEKKYGLRIGKKRINFYKGSGILDATCDKMYSETYLTLPGGFHLPIAIVTEQWTVYDGETVCTASEAADITVQQFALEYLNTQMVSGRVIARQVLGEQQDSLYTLHGQYTCLEMIGRIRNEEIIEDYGKSD